MLQEISKEVWNHNYRAPKEKNLQATWDRQAKAAASVEKPEIREQIYKDFLWLLSDFRAMAGGRITANLGVEGREGTTLMNCFIAGTKVFTSTGYKNIEDIIVGDYVLTHTGNYRRVHNTLNRKYKGTVNRFSDSSLLNDIIATPEHPFFTKDNDWNIASTADHLVFAKKQDSTDFRYIQYDDTNIMVSNDIAYLFGRFVGDGCIFHNGNKDNYDYNSFNIAFASTEIEAMNKLRSIFESSFNISVNINSHNSQQVSYIRKYNPVFAAFIRDNIGTNAHNKRIPEFIFTSPLHIQKSFLLGLFDADGFIQSNKVLRIDLANENLINDVMLLGRFQGINFRKKKLTNKLSKHDTYSLCASSNSSYDFYTSMSKTYNDDRMEIKKDANAAYKFKSINDNIVIYTDSEEEYFDGIVYNISVEIDESYIVNNVIVHNCFVHNPRDIGYRDPDSIEGIYDMLKAQALTLKSEGGYGMNFSWMRPAGMYVKGIGSRTPGVVQFMSLWNQSSGVITMGSDKVLGELRDDEKKKIRKGAQMGILEVWHPEIEDFIDAKLVQGQLNKFNISVGITPGFMEAVEKDKTWVLKFPDTECDAYEKYWGGSITDWEQRGLPTKVYKKIKARDLWDKIMKATYTRNDPGVLFLDLANKLNPLAYAEDIATTNPCFTGDMRFLTELGYKRFDTSSLETNGELIHTDNRITYESTWNIEPSESRLTNVKSISNAFITKETADVVRVELDNGQVIKCTPDHSFATTCGMINACDLTPEHDILITIPTIGPESNEYCIDIDELTTTSCYYKDSVSALLMGLIAGDGTFGKSAAIIDLWGDDADRMKHIILPLIDWLYNNYYEQIPVLDSGWNSRKLSSYYISEGDNKIRISSTWLAYYLEYNYGFNKSTKFTVPNIVLEKARTPVGRAYVSGLNYADATVSGSVASGVSVRLAQSNINLLRDVQLIYHANGINSKIYKRRDAHIKRFGNDECQCKSQYELITIDGSWKSYNRVFDFVGHPDKESKLTKLCNEVTKEYSKISYAKIVAYEVLEQDTVYCVTEPDTHSLIVQTASVRNCGEIAMSTGVCNLMSLNLVKYIKVSDDGKRTFDFETFSKAVTIAVRFSDNINDISRAPLEEYKDSMTSKRRIGIGVLGFGSLHYMLGIRYGSEESLKLTYSIFRCKAESEIYASANLGVEKGSFTSFDKNEYFNTYWWQNIDLSPEFKRNIESMGAMRNSHRSANAPTGNMSVYAGVVSGGIEPVFMREYTRWVIVPEKDQAKLKEQGLVIPAATRGEWFETEVFKSAKRGTDDILRGSFNGNDYEIDKGRGLVKANQVIDYGWDYVKSNFDADTIAKMESDGVFATTEDLGVDDHVKPLAIIAQYTDMNSSKTINLPNDYPYEEFKTVYMNAWKGGIKGITTYRDGTMTAVLEKKLDTQEKKEELENMFANAKGDVILESVKIPDEYYSKGVVVRDHNKKKWYVNIAFADSALTRPFALFVHTNSKETTEVAEETVTSMMKLAKDMGIKKDLIDDQLTKYEGQSNVTKIARCIGFLLRHNVPIINIVDVLDEGNYPLSSFPFHLKRLLKQYIADGTEVQGKNKICPKCGGHMIFQEGCILCRDCAYSKCS